MSRVVKVPIVHDEQLLEGGNLKWREGFEVEITNASDAIGWVRLVAEYDRELGRYVCASIEVKRAGAGTELTGSALRDIRVAETIQLAALDNIWVDSIVSGSSLSLKINGETHTPAADVLEGLPKVSGRTTDNDVSSAVLAYAIAEVSGLPVLRTVGKALGTSQSTAKRLVARAKELGLVGGSAGDDG